MSVFTILKDRTKTIGLRRMSGKVVEQHTREWVRPRTEVVVTNQWVHTFDASTYNSVTHFIIELSSGERFTMRFDDVNFQVNTGDELIVYLFNSEDHNETAVAAVYNRRTKEISGGHYPEYFFNALLLQAQSIAAYLILFALTLLGVEMEMGLDKHTFFWTCIWGIPSIVWLVNKVRRRNKFKTIGEIVQKNFDGQPTDAQHPIYKKSTGSKVFIGLAILVFPVLFLARLTGDYFTTIKPEAYFLEHIQPSGVFTNQQIGWIEEYQSALRWEELKRVEYVLKSKQPETSIYAYKKYETWQLIDPKSTDTPYGGSNLNGASSFISEKISKEGNRYAALVAFWERMGINAYLKGEKGNNPTYNALNGGILNNLQLSTLTRAQLIHLVDWVLGVPPSDVNEQLSAHLVTRMKKLECQDSQKTVQRINTRYKQHDIAPLKYINTASSKYCNQLETESRERAYQEVWEYEQNLGRKRAQSLLRTYENGSAKDRAFAAEYKRRYW